MRRIGGTKPRPLPAKKPVTLSKSVDALGRKRPPTIVDPKLRPSASTKSTKSTTNDSKQSRTAIARVGSSPRSGLMPKQTIKMRRSPSVDSESSMTSTPTTPLSPVQLQVPSTAFHGMQRQAYSVPIRKSISCVTDDLFDKDTIQDAPEYHGSDLSALSIKEKQKSEELAARLPPPSVRRHASLAVDNSRRLNTVRSSTLKRGSLTMEQIKKIDLDAEYSVYKQLGSGRFGFIKLAEHKQAKKKIAIKFFPRPQVKQGEFVREYNYSFFLSPHPNIIDTYDGMFASNDDSAFFFVQEFCPHASLREAVETSPGGLSEETTKAIMNGVLSAVEFMHNENLVHRNLKTENVLIFDNKTYSRVKITDFGLTRKIDTTVKHLEYVTNYHAPELCETVVNEVLTVRDTVDIWALGIIFYYCLKGRFPWQKATIMCKPYWEWEQWLKRKNPALPKRWEPFSDKALKIFKRSLNPKPKDRWSAKDMRKCIMKEKLLKPIKSDSPDEYVYYPENPSKEDRLEEPKPQKKRSIISQWINTTLNTMAEISEQVVSARDE